MKGLDRKLSGGYLKLVKFYPPVEKPVGRCVFAYLTDGKEYRFNVFFRQDPKTKKYEAWVTQKVWLGPTQEVYWETVPPNVRAAAKRRTLYLCYRESSKMVAA